MQRTGSALVLGVTPFAEAGALVVLFCPQHGKLRGLLKSRKRAAALQPMDEVRYTHTRRVEGQLGTFQLEVAVSRAHFWLGGAGGGEQGALAVGWLQELLTVLMLDENPYPMLAEALAQLVHHWPHNWAENWRAIAQFERLVLAQVGYGLRLADDPVPCDSQTALTYVSPSSGRAVSAAVGQPYAPHMLTLPAMWGGAACPDAADAYHALTLTGYFMAKAAHGAMLPARARLWSVVLHNLQGEQTNDCTDGNEYFNGRQRVVGGVG